MKKLILSTILMCFAFAKAYSQQTEKQDSTLVDTSSMVMQEKQSPVDAVKDFFKHLHAKDTLAMREMMAYGASLHSLSISERQGRKISHEKIDAFFKSIANIPDSTRIEERLIQIKSTDSVDIACVTASYEFFVNDGFTHNGTNVFTLVYIDDSWKITSISDTRYYP